MSTSLFIPLIFLTISLVLYCPHGFYVDKLIHTSYFPCYFIGVLLPPWLLFGVLGPACRLNYAGVTLIPITMFVSLSVLLHVFGISLALYFSN